MDHAPLGLALYVQFEPFVAAWKRLGLGDADLRAVEAQIAAGPARHPVIQGTGGVRKMRFAPPGRNAGKSGGLRIAYKHWPEHGVVVLLGAIDKTQTADFSAAEKAATRRLIHEIGEYLGRTP